VVQSLNVTPYFFGQVQRKALALKLKGLDVTAGKQLAVRADYALAEVPYPLSEPAKIPFRKLPQVDVFQYVPAKTFDMLDKSNLFSLQSFFALQVPNGTFEETPDVEDSTYDYYKLYPYSKQHTDVQLTVPRTGFENWKNAKNVDVINWIRGLFQRNAGYESHYNLHTIFDATISSDTAVVDRVDLLFSHYRTSSDSPAYKLAVGGKFSEEDGVGLSAFWSVQGLMEQLSMVRLCDNWGGVPKEVWRHEAVITVAVNDSSMGATSPAVGTYKITSIAQQYYYAYPNSGYVFAYWKKDGIKVSTRNPLVALPDTDHTYTAVFESG